MDEKREDEYLQVYLDSGYVSDSDAVEYLMQRVNTILKSIVQSGGSVVENNIEHASSYFVVRIIYTLPAGATLSIA